MPCLWNLDVVIHSLDNSYWALCSVYGIWHRTDVIPTARGCILDRKQLCMHRVFQENPKRKAIQCRHWQNHGDSGDLWHRKEFGIYPKSTGKPLKWNDNMSKKLWVSGGKRKSERLLRYLCLIYFHMHHIQWLPSSLPISYNLITSKKRVGRPRLSSCLTQCSTTLTVNEWNEVN